MRKLTRTSGQHITKRREFTKQYVYTHTRETNRRGHPDGPYRRAYKMNYAANMTRLRNDRRVQ